MLTRDNDFHGGDKPDKADFMLYSLIRSKMKSESMRKFFEKKVGDEFKSWYFRLSKLCTNQAKGKVSVISGI